MSERSPRFAAQTGPPEGGGAFERAPVPAPKQERSPALERYRAQAEQFIARNRELFWAIAGDRSLTFTVGSGFFIDLEHGMISLDLGKWKWAEERGLSEEQLVWATCHELAHYLDLRENPREMLGNFEYLKRRAKQLGPEVLEIWRQKFSDGVLPDYLTKEVPAGKDPKTGAKRTTPYVEAFLYDKLHLLYNCLDDRYVNGTVGVRVGAFHEERGSAAGEVTRLYRDYLFPTDPKRRGAPPQEEEAADYSKMPKSYQLAYALLREQMVPEQAMLVADDVRAVLSGFPDAIAEHNNRTLRDEVAAFTRTVPRGRGQLVAQTPADPAWRYEQIKRLVEPAYLAFLREDLRKMNVPKPAPPGGSGGEGGEDDGWGVGDPAPPDGEPEEDPKDGKPQAGKSGDGKSAGGDDPWKELDDRPEPIDLDVIRDFINQQNTLQRKRAREDREQARAARLTPQDKLRNARRSHDRTVCDEHDVDPALAIQYRALEQSVAPYVEELGQVFEQIMKTVTERMRAVLLTGFRQGTFDVERFIGKYAPELAAERPEDIPWEALETYLQREYIPKLVLFPNKLRVRFVLDGSGSMGSDRINAVRQLYVLFQEALGSFEANMNLRFRMREPFHVDTEVRMFGSKGASDIAKHLTADAPLTADGELAAKFRALGKITSNYGVTCDAEPLWGIADSMDDVHREDLAEGRAREFVLLVTDGGSNDASAHAAKETSGPQDTRNALEALRRVGARAGKEFGVIARGFQIGEPTEDERTTFRSIWGTDGRETPHPADLAPAVAEMFADAMRQIEFDLQFYGETVDDEEDE
ncbi:MAG: VWA domain-containing protein [bacterium]|nr:VWA domain-containing protein [bacterium]